MLICWVGYKIKERIFCSHLASLTYNMLLTEGVIHKLNQDQLVNMSSVCNWVAKMDVKKV